jgi:pimeloyl-ACP methyl ester carboxylesterase
LIIMDSTPGGVHHSHVSANGSSIHVAEIGDPQKPSFLFLHGWPETWRSWEAIMQLAALHAHAVAIDLPGIGESSGAVTDGSKRQLAETIHALISALDLRRVTLVGQDVGGMITYAYLRAYPDIERAVIMDVVIPGVDPWEAVVRNPYIWHFAARRPRPP